MKRADVEELGLVIRQAWWPQAEDISGCGVFHEAAVAALAWVREKIARNAVCYAHTVGDTLEFLTPEPDAEVTDAMVEAALGASRCCKIDAEEMRTILTVALEKMSR